MTFITKRVQAALQAFRNPASTMKTGWVVNGINDMLYGGGSGVSGSNRDITFTEQGAATAFDIIVEVQRGVMFIADSIAMLPAGIYDSRTDELILSLDTRTLDLSKPGATFIAAIRHYERRWMHNFIESIIFSDWLYGETFVKRLSNPMGGVVGVRWLNPLYTEPYIQQGRIEYYRYMAWEDSADMRKPILPAEMAFRIHHRTSREDLRGQSPVLSALNSMNIERNAEREMMSYFRNGMILGGMLMPEAPEKTLSDVQVNRMKTDMRQHHNGVDNAYRWIIAPMKMASTTFDQPDLEKNYAVVSAASKKIMMALGVPPELAGNPDSVSYDNADKIMTNWLKVNGKAYASKLASFINTSLLCYFEPDAPVYFKFDFTQVDRQEAGLVQNDFSGGAITINEARAQRGYKTDDRLDGILNWGGKPIHIDTLVEIARDPAAFTGQPALPELPGGIGYHPGTVTMPTPPTIPALPVPQEQPEPQKGANSLCIMLTFANNPDLLTKLAELKRIYPDPAIRWTDPADLHVTLLIAPSVDDEQLDALPEAMAGYGIDGLSLPVGSLACFDTGTGQHALHYGIRRQVEFLAMQADIYDTCKAIGMQMTSTSKPGEGYIPHITVAYLPEHMSKIKFTGRLKIEPTDLVCSVERNGDYEIIWSANAPEVEAEAATEEPETAKAVTIDFTVSDGGFKADLQHGDHTHEIAIVQRDYSPSKALAELKAWRTYTMKGKTRPFEFDMLRGEPADYIAERQAAGDSPDAIMDALKSRFDGSALKALTAQFAAIYEQAWTDIDGAIKALGSIESEFTSRFAPVIESMRDGSLTSRQRAGNILRQLIRVFGARAYRQGLEDGGVTDPPDEDEQATIDRLISDQSGYVSSLTDRVLSKDGENDTLAAGNADSWWRKSILVFYYAGFESAKGNAMMIFTGEDGAESCTTCQSLKGKKRRMKWWTKNKKRPQVDTESFECGGWKCNHYLEEVTGASDA